MYHFSINICIWNCLVYCYMYYKAIKLCLYYAVLSDPCSLLITCWEKGWLLGSFVWDVFLCSCHFLIWRLWSGVVLNCIDSGFLTTLVLCVCHCRFLMLHKSIPYPFKYMANIPISPKTIEGHSSIRHSLVDGLWMWQSLSYLLVRVPYKEL